MSATKGFYITTPIYYVNGLPHIGHAYTTLAADTATRWQRLLGRDAFFLTGTDEHGQKVLQKAVQRGMTPIEHCDDMVVHWKEAWKRLNIQYDHFLRTTDAAHIEAVQAALIDLKDRGLLYTQQYEGWYSEAAERFWTEKDLVDGKCPDTGLPVVFLSEENWFFKMSQFQGQLIAHIEAHPEYIQPASRRNEVLGFLRKPLGDLCISRPKSRMSWGIEIPFAPDYVTYVWFDALLNYLTGIGWMPGGSRVHDAWWPADFQLVGKDILTTHAVYWSTMLMALEVPLPRTIYAHGWWVAADGQKMSKSLGNTIDVGLLADSYGVDAARYFFLREIAFGADGGFSYEIFLNRYNADLANDLGNLGHRGLSMTTNWLGGVVPPLGELTDLDRELIATSNAAIQGFVNAIEKLQFQDALASLFTAVGAANKYIDTTQPWTLNKNGDLDRLRTVKRCVLEVCALAGVLLLPVMPTKAAELLAKLGISAADHARYAQRLAFGGAQFDLLVDGTAVEVGDPLFPRFREHPEAIATLLAEAERLAAAEAEAEKAAKAAQKAAEKAAKKAQAEAAPSKAELAAAPGDTISYEDFAKVKLRMGQILSAEKHPKADKLLVLQVDVGEAQPRQIVAGIATKFAPDELVGRKVVVVVNLAPAKLRGVESQGMLLAAGTDAVVDLVSAHAHVGEVVR